MPIVECPDCGWTAQTNGSPWGVLDRHRPHCGRKGWDAAPLREVPMSNGRGVKRRRDLRDLDPKFLASEIEQAWPCYLSTFHRRNASIGEAIFDADDIEGELRMLLTEAATRFDGRGQFAAWACSKQRQDLLDCRRRMVGRSIADAELAISRGQQVGHKLAADVATVHALCNPISIDAPMTAEGAVLADILADVTPMETCAVCEDVAWVMNAGELHPLAVAERIGKSVAALEMHLRRCGRDDLRLRFEPGIHAAKKTPTPNTHRKKETMSLQPVQRPPLHDLIAHDDPQVARAAAKAKSALDACYIAYYAWQDNEGIRAKIAEHEAAAKALKAQLRGGKPTPKPEAKVDYKAVRAWAEANGYEVPKVGRIGAEIVAAYNAAILGVSGGAGGAA